MIPEHELRQMYHGDGMLQREIAELCGVTQTTISVWIRQYGIELRTKSDSNLIRTRRINASKPPKEDIIEMYHVKKMTQLDISKFYGVHTWTISRLMQEYGINIRTQSEIRTQDSINIAKEKLCEMYDNRHMSISKIACEIGVSTSYISKMMKSHGIESRKLSDYTGENASNWCGGISGGNYCYKFNNTFKEAVRKRDDYTCQLCGNKQNGRKLSIHHIHYKKSDCWPDVVALCSSCHAKTTSGDRNSWEEYFENQLIDRGFFCWSISREIDNT